MTLALPGTILNQLVRHVTETDTHVILLCAAGHQRWTPAENTMLEGFLASHGGVPPMEDVREFVRGVRLTGHSASDVRQKLYNMNIKKCKKRQQDVDDGRAWSCLEIYMMQKFSNFELEMWLSRVSSNLYVRLTQRWH